LDTSACLEQQLDADMARTLAEDVAADDHNADKKFGAGSQTTDGCEAAVTLTGGAVKSPSNATLSVSEVAREQQDRESILDSRCHPAPGLYFYSRLSLSRLS